MSDIVQQMGREKVMTDTFCSRILVQPVCTELVAVILKQLLEIYESVLSVYLTLFYCFNELFPKTPGLS